MSIIFNIALASNELTLLNSKAKVQPACTIRLLMEKAYLLAVILTRIGLIPRRSLPEQRIIVSVVSRRGREGSIENAQQVKDRF